MTFLLGLNILLKVTPAGGLSNVSCLLKDSLFTELQADAHLYWQMGGEKEISGEVFSS